MSLCQCIIQFYQMRSSRLRKPSNGGQNEFLETPRTNRRNLKEKERLSEDIKAKYIQELQQRNRKLKYEIIKINEMLDEQKEKTVVKKQHKLIPQDSSSEVIKKELENVYKQIRNYEREIRNLENKQAGGMITDKMSRLELILKEKNQHLEKLKSELTALTKTSNDNSKKLKNNAGKEQLENMMLKYNEEIKILREKVREAEEKEKKKAENAKKQFDYIKKLERELIENGTAIDELEELKRNNIFNQIYDKLNNGGADDEKVSRVVKSNEKEEPIEDMTLDRFNELKNQIKLYKKLQLDYDKRLEVLEKQKGVEEKQTDTIKSKMHDKDEEISKLHQQIGELKSKIKSVNLKPNYSLTKGESKDKKKEKPKVSPTKLKTNQTKTITDQTHIKYDEKGQSTSQGQKFTDRNILGKTTDCKIVGVKVWAEKSTFAINGIQCTYKVNGSIKEGQEHINREGKKNCSQIVMQLPDGDYIKSVSGHLSQGNVIEYLVFISAQNKIIGRFGMAKQTQKQFNYDIDEDEIPICMYGSISNTKDNKKEGSIIENLGFEISRDKGLSKDDRYV